MTFHPQEIDLKQYGLLLRRRKKLVLGTVGACVLVALAVNLLTEPVYRATTRIEVLKEPTRSPLTGEAIASYGWNSDNVALYTAAELITNRALLRDVVMALRESGNLVKEAPRQGAMLRALGRRGSASPRPGMTNASWRSAESMSEADLTRDIDWLLKITRVKPINETRLVMIQVDHWVPRVAQTIADTLASQFVAHEQRKRASDDKTRLQYMEQQLEQVKARIENSERVLYSSNELGVSVLENKLKQLTEASGHMNEAHVNAQAERLAVEARLKLVRSALKDSLMAWDEVPVENETVQGLWRELLQTRTELARAREIYKARHPRLMVLESQLQSLQSNIRAELRKAVGALEAEYAMLKGREAGLQGSLAHTENELRTTNDRHGRHSALESELKSNRDLYAMLMAKAQELKISGEVQQPLVGVVEAATLSPRPVRPRPALNLVMSMIVGLSGGAGLALLTEFLRRTIKTPKDITEILDLPVLGMIPKSQT